MLAICLNIYVNFFVDGLPCFCEVTVSKPSVVVSNLLLPAACVDILFTIAENKNLLIIAYDIQVVPNVHFVMV